MNVRRRVLPWLPELAVLVSAALVLAAVPILSAPAAVVLVLWAPGALTVRWLGSRQLVSGSAVALSLALSLALSPVIVYWASLLAGFSRPVVTLALAGVALGMGMLARQWPRPRPHPSPLPRGEGTIRPGGGALPLPAGEGRGEGMTHAAGGALPLPAGEGRGEGMTHAPIFTTPRYRALLAALLLALAVLLALPYLHVWRHGVLLEPSVGDWVKHFTVAWLIERSGIPPRTLLYPPWQDQPFAYYYFFHIVVATLHLLGGGLLSLVNAFVLALVTVALTLVALVASFARRLFDAERPALFAALFVSLAGGSEGLLLLPQISANITAGGFSLGVLFGLEPIGDCRASRIVDFYSVYLWAPQHAAAALIFVLGLLLLQSVGLSRRPAVLAPVLLFALAGYSIYVAIPVVAALAIYAGLDVYRQARQALPGGRFRSALRRAAVWLAIAAASIVLAWPYVRDLWGTRLAETSGLALTVTPNGVGWLDGAVLSQLMGGSPVTRLLDAPTHYLSQIGALVLLGLGGWAVYLRQPRAKETASHAAYHLLMLAALAGFVLTLFLASKGAVLGLQGAPLWLGCNDFRSRGVLPLQIALAVFAGLGLAAVVPDFLRSRSLWRRLIGVLAVVLVVLSMAGTLRYAAGRTVGRLASPQGVTAEAMQAYQFVRTQTPPDALFQGGPGRDFALRRYADRISRVETSVHTLIPAPMADKLADQRAVQQVFSATTAEEAWSLLARLGVDYLFVGPEERLRFAGQSDLGQFADPRYFQPIYTSGTHQVYRVLPAPGSPHD